MARVLTFCNDGCVQEFIDLVVRGRKTFSDLAFPGCPACHRPVAVPRPAPAKGPPTFRASTAGPGRFQDARRDRAELESRKLPPPKPKGFQGRPPS